MSWGVNELGSVDVSLSPLLAPHTARLRRFERNVVAYMSEWKRLWAALSLESAAGRNSFGTTKPCVLAPPIGARLGSTQARMKLKQTLGRQTSLYRKWAVIHIGFQFNSVNIFCMDN